MADTPSPNPANADPEAQYRINLARTVKIGSVVLSPRNDNVVKGKVLATLGDALKSFEPA